MSNLGGMHPWRPHVAPPPPLHPSGSHLPGEACSGRGRSLLPGRLWSLSLALLGRSLCQPGSSSGLTWALTMSHLGNPEGQEGHSAKARPQVG